MSPVRTDWKLRDRTAPDPGAGRLVPVLVSRNGGMPDGFRRRPMTFQFAGLELDQRRQELRREGMVVHLEPQVFDLLLLLLRNRDRIVSKDEILDAIWQGRFVSEAALSSRMNAARKAIGDSGNDQRLIRTYHKRGFRFVGEVVHLAEGEGDASEGPGDPSRSGGLRSAPAAAGAGTLEAGPQRVGGGRPTIAVMPFRNLSPSTDDDYFAYGLTEDIIRLLGRYRWLMVLTRHTMAGYRGADVDLRTAGAELSVRRQGERVRISTELDDAETGSQLWSEVYELSLSDIFDIQDAMAQQIAAAIEPEVADVEQHAAARKPPEKLDAWDCYQRGFWHLWGFTTPGFLEAEILFKRAIALEPGLARAHAGLSYVYFQRCLSEPEDHRSELIRMAWESARAAVSLDDRDPLCHCVLGRAHTIRRNYSDAVAALTRTIELNPSFAQGYFALAFAHLWNGGEEDAIALVERAIELSPRDPHLRTFYTTLALAHLSLSELDEAAHFARHATRLPNTTHWAEAVLAAALGLLGRRSEAEEAARLLIEKRPSYRQSSVREELFFCPNDRLIERFEEGLRQAGIPA
jgi:TolB-like protein/DNA-binding winged helix-turn-helix (wHTH) protein